MKLVVINSAGPMGSTVLGALIEKMGFLNLPARKRDLHGYLEGRRSLDDTYFQRRTIDILNGMARASTGGGTSVVDRNSAQPIVRAEPERVRDKLTIYLSRPASSIVDMVIDGNELLAESVVYKKIEIGESIGAIEYTTNIEEYRARAAVLYECYVREFGNVVFFHMQRGFESWVNSLISQYLLARKLQLGHFYVRLSALRGRYAHYQESVAHIPGHFVDFDDLFLPKTSALAARIAAILDVEPPSALECDTYDLYGKLSEFQKTFTKEDDNYAYISRFARRIVNHKPRNKLESVVEDILFLSSYLVRLAAVKIFGPSIIKS